MFIVAIALTTIPEKDLPLRNTNVKQAGLQLFRLDSLFD